MFTAENTGKAEGNCFGAGVAQAAGRRAAQVAIVSCGTGVNRTIAWPRYVTPSIVNASSSSAWAAKMTWLLRVGLRRRAKCAAQTGQTEQQPSRMAECRRTNAAALFGLSRRSAGQPSSTQQVCTGAARAYRTSSLSPRHNALLPQHLAEGPHQRGLTDRTTAAAEVGLAEGTRPNRKRVCDAVLLTSTTWSRSIIAGQFPPPQAANRPKDAPLPVKKVPYGRFPLYFLYSLMCPLLYRFGGKNVPPSGRSVPLCLEKMYRLMSKNVPPLLCYDRQGRSEAWTSD